MFVFSFKKIESLSIQRNFLIKKFNVKFNQIGLLADDNMKKSINQKKNNLQKLLVSSREIIIMI